MSSILSIIIFSLAYLFLIYELIITIYFLLSFFTNLYGTRFFGLLERIARPFTTIFSGKIIIGRFDFGGILGLIILSFIVRALFGFAQMI